MSLELVPNRSYKRAYPFGMVMPGREYGQRSSFLYQGYEYDYELHNYSTFYRNLNFRLGVWSSVDPEYDASLGSYVGMENNPILHIDVLGDKIKYGDGSKDDKRRIKAQLRQRKRADKEFRVELRKNMWHYRFSKNNLVIQDHKKQYREKDENGKEITVQVSASTVQEAEFRSRSENGDTYLEWNIGLYNSKPSFIHFGTNIRENANSVPLDQSPEFNEIGLYLMAHTDERITIVLYVFKNSTYNVPVFYDDKTPIQGLRQSQVSRRRQRALNAAVRRNNLTKPVRGRITVVIRAADVMPDRRELPKENQGDIETSKI